MTLYFDTSAALKLVVEESESEELIDELERRAGEVLVSSMLLHAELLCAAARRSRVIDEASVRNLLTTITLVDLERRDLTTAPSLPGRLRAGDAIHLATAIRLRCDRMISYDAQLNAAAEAAGLSVLAPS